MKDVKTVIKFNTHLLNFVNELISIYPNMKQKVSNYNLLDVHNVDYLLSFQTKIKPFLSFIIDNNSDIIMKPIFDNIDLSNVKMTLQTKQTIFKYINVMFIQSFKYDKSKEKLNEIIRMKNELDKVSDLETKAFLISIDNLKNNKKVVEESNSNSSNMPDNIDINNGFLNQLPIDNSIMGGSIGKLAMDIAKDIDISKLEMNNPMEMLQGIMTGDLNKSSGLKNLFGNITEKINKKLNSGEVDKDEILSDAQNIMKKTNNMSNNDYFKNIQKNINENLETIEKDIPEISNVTETIKHHLNEVNSQLSESESDNSNNSTVSKETLLKDLSKKKKQYLLKKLHNLKKQK